MSKTVTNKYSGRLFHVNDDELTDWTESHMVPRLTHASIENMSLVTDAVNKCEYLIGDFAGTTDVYGFSLKIFLYQKDKKALGTFRYVVDAGMPDGKISAMFRAEDDGISVYGFYTGISAEGKQCFILIGKNSAAGV
ncbi:MAG: hypothetical protein EOP48_25355 [Sphingobacteriales bacterium]|nr:MAG: hypothetical protein EOP48_25355 [Sphingobacteriales bacterium]